MQFIHTSLFLPDNQSWLKTWDIVILFLGSHARMLRIICWHSDKKRKIIRVNTKVKRKIGRFCDVKLVKLVKSWYETREMSERAHGSRVSITIKCMHEWGNTPQLLIALAGEIRLILSTAINSFYTCHLFTLWTYIPRWKCQPPFRLHN